MDHWSKLRAGFRRRHSIRKLEHIFDRFHRGDDNSIIQGFGLGLPIARSLAERQAGTIRMESEPGKGSSLVIDFPRLT
jgi:signal transduction histidine kinase